MVHYTPQEQRILHLLSDGLPHGRKYVHACLYDELSGKTALSRAICVLRRKLLPQGQTIVFEIPAGRGSESYRHVRLLNADTDE